MTVANGSQRSAAAGRTGLGPVTAAGQEYEAARAAGGKNG